MVKYNLRKSDPKERIGNTRCLRLDCEERIFCKLDPSLCLRNIKSYKSLRQGEEDLKFGKLSNPEYSRFNGIEKRLDYRDSSSARGLKYRRFRDLSRSSYEGPSDYSKSIDYNSTKDYKKGGKY